MISDSLRVALVHVSIQGGCDEKGVVVENMHALQFVVSEMGSLEKR